ncbi:MAG: STAS domain-containing protein [Planctomycetes bacterium]|nr:STAS domain-containing protein [Planctomycetota bacterium]
MVDGRGADADNENSRLPETFRKSARLWVEFMSLSVSTSNYKSTEVLSLNGNLDAIGAEIADAFVASVVLVPTVWEVSALKFVSSAGIRSLIKLAKRLRSNGKRPRLVGLKPSIQDLFTTAGLKDHWDYFECMADALADDLPADSMVEGVGMVASSGISYKNRRGAIPMTLTIFESNNSAKMMPVSLRELGISIGFGGFGGGEKQTSENAGLFASTGSLFAVMTPAHISDFMQAASPEKAFAFVSWAVKINGDGRDIFDAQSTLLLGQIKQDTNSFAYERGAKDFIACASCNINGKQAVMIGTKNLLREQWVAIQGEQPLPIGGMTTIRSAMLALSSDDEPSVVNLTAETVIDDCRIWFEASPAVRSCIEERMQIIVEETIPVDWEIIIRSIFTEESRVILKRLTGGFTSSTFAAETYDISGRKTLPTVLKISQFKIAKREELAYHESVRPFILNNATVLFGKASHGDYTGLRYNFVGITGVESKLRSLESIYLLGDIDKVLSILHDTAENVLAPWFGQAKPKKLNPFKDHDLRSVFPRLPEIAQDLLGIDIKNPRLYCAELSREVVNPFWFIKYRYDSYLAYTAEWNKSITHGDFNLNNILVDERNNIYVIDFSETKERNVASDFARLEPIVLLQLTRISDSLDVAKVLRVTESLLVGNIFSPQVTICSGNSDPMLVQAQKVIHTLRRLAADRVSSLVHEGAYLLPLFQWTAPIVCYVQAGIECKRAAAFSAGLCLERLLSSLKWDAE